MDSLDHHQNQARIAVLVKSLLFIVKFWVKKKQKSIQEKRSGPGILISPYDSGSGYIRRIKTGLSERIKEGL
jgi:hypothetical protein